MAARWTRRSAIVAGALAPLAALTTWKAWELSADPTDAKDCACNPSLTETACDAAPAPGMSAQGMPSAAPQPQWAQAGGFINDASCLNRTPIYGLVRVRGVEDIATALRFARENGRKVSIAGVRHSMGGQAFARDAVVLDITEFNQVSLDAPRKLITAQSGATWHAIQELLHPALAVKAMQSTDIFTVGGSISVNAHGMDHRAGSIARTIRSLRLMLADGSIQTLSRTENPALFDLVVGGYGLFGVILDAELEVTENAVYRTGRQMVDYRDFPEIFESELAPNPDLGLFYGHLSTAPQSLLREMILYTYETQTVPDAEIPPLGEIGNTRLRRFLLNFAKVGDLPKRLKWFAETRLEPRLEACSVVSRAQAMQAAEACLVSRNEPMHDSVKYLRNNLGGETDILQEYFIPRDQFQAFVDGLRQVVTTQAVTLLNASVRVVHEESNFLNYAPFDGFAVVLYVNQATTSEGNDAMRRVTEALIDLTAQLGGRFFLPYQLHYSAAQLERAYPEIRAFFAAKRKYDPGQVLTNTFYEKYAPTLASA